MPGWTLNKEKTWNGLMVATLVADVGLETVRVRCKSSLPTYKLVRGNLDLSLKSATVNMIQN